MKSISITELKQTFASIITEAEAGCDVLITKHNKSAARPTRPDIQHLHTGSQFGKTKLNPAVRRKTAGRFLQMLKEDRSSGAR